MAQLLDADLCRTGSFRPEVAKTLSMAAAGPEAAIGPDLCHAAGQLVAFLPVLTMQYFSMADGAMRIFRPLGAWHPNEGSQAHNGPLAKRPGLIKASFTAGYRWRD